MGVGRGCAWRSPLSNSVTLVRHWVDPVCISVRDRLNPPLPVRPSSEAIVNRPLLVILAAVTLDSIGIGLIFPILPKLLEEVTHVDNIAPYVGIMFALY